MANFAFENESFVGVDAARVWPAPAAVVDALRQARRVVTIGHAPPDGDCVGAALGLARGLRELGREAHAIVDAALPAGLHGLGQQGDLHRGPPPFDPDVVVLVDVAQADRIGGARDLVAKAPAVVVIDHHRVAATASELGICETTPLTTWIEDRCDAASLMVASVLEALGGAPNGWADEWADVAAPLAAGIATDTQWFRAPRAQLQSLAVFKCLLDGDINAFEALEAILGHPLPPTVTATLAEELAMTIIRHGPATVAELVVAHRGRERALRGAQARDARVTVEDVSGYLMDRLDRLALKHHIAVLLQEEREGRVRVSVRSRCDHEAVELATRLGGGGRRGVAGATVRGTLFYVQAEVRRQVAAVVGSHRSSSTDQWAPPVL